MFICLSSTRIQNFSTWHALFVFLSHSVAVASWSGIQRVDPQMIHFELFYHLVRRSQFNPQTIFVWFRQLKKTYFGHSSKKDNHPRPLPQQGFCTSLQIWDELGVTWQTKQSFFLPPQGPLNLNILNTFSWPFLNLAGWLCESFLVESPILYLAFFKTILAASFRTFGLPLRFLPSKLPFLHDHFTTQHSNFSSFLSSFYNR